MAVTPSPIRHTQLWLAVGVVLATLAWECGSLPADSASVDNALAHGNVTNCSFNGSNGGNGSNVSGGCPELSTTSTTTTTTTPFWLLSDSIVCDANGMCICAVGFEPTAARHSHVLPDYMDLCQWPFVGSLCSPCAPGTIKSENGTYVCSECPAGTKALKSSGASMGCAATQCVLCGMGSWSSVGATQCTLAPIGTYGLKVGCTSLDEPGCFAQCPDGTITELGADHILDCDCAPGTYGDVNDVAYQEKCWPCIEGLFCPGGDPSKAMPYARIGWREVEASFTAELANEVSSDADYYLKDPMRRFLVARCPAPGACPNNPVNNRSCADGMEGTLCDSCKEGYYKLALNERSARLCSECPTSLWLMIRAVVIILGVAIITWLIVHAIQNVILEASSIYVMIFKITYSYLFFSAYAIRTALTEPPEAIKAIGKIFVETLEALALEEVLQQRGLAFDCIIPHIPLTMLPSAFSGPFGNRFILFVGFIPLVLFMLVLFEIFLYFFRKFKACAKRCKGKSKGKGYVYVAKQARCFDFFKRKVPNLLVVFFVMYPILAFEAWRGWFCRSIHPTFPTKMFFVYDLDIECGLERSTLWIVAAGAQLIYSVVMPFMMSWWVGLTTTGPSRKRLAKDTFKREWGFLYDGYEDRCVAWEGLVFFQKGLVIFIYTWPRWDRTQRMVNMIVVSLIFLAIHIWGQPYDNRAHKILDKLQSAACWSFIMTLATGLAVSYGSKDVVGLYQKSLEQVVLWSTLGSHLVFATLLFYTLIRTSVLLPMGFISRHLFFYNPYTKEFDLTKLDKYERDLFVTVIEDSIKQHVDTLDCFSFAYIEAAVKEGFYPKLYRKARIDKEKEVYIQKKEELDSAMEAEGIAPPGAPPADAPKKKKKGLLPAFGRKKKKGDDDHHAEDKKDKKDAGEPNALVGRKIRGIQLRVIEDSELTLDWVNEGMDIEHWQLQLLKQHLQPVDMFFKDVKEAEQRLADENDPVKKKEREGKKPPAGKDKKDPFAALTAAGGLTEKCIKPERRNKAWLERERKRIKREERLRAEREDVHRAKRKGKFEDLFGAEEVVMEVEPEKAPVPGADDGAVEEEDGVLMAWDVNDGFTFMLKAEDAVDTAEDHNVSEETPERKLHDKAQYFQGKWDEKPEIPKGLEPEPHREEHLMVTDTEETMGVPDDFFKSLPEDRFPERGAKKDK